MSHAVTLRHPISAKQTEISGATAFAISGQFHIDINSLIQNFLCFYFNTDNCLNIVIHVLMYVLLLGKLNTKFDYSKKKKFITRFFFY